MGFWKNLFSGAAAPASGPGYDDLMREGLALTQRGEFTAAVEFFERAIEQDETRHEAWYWKAGAVSRQADVLFSPETAEQHLALYEVAVQSVSRAIEIEPSYVPAWVMRARFHGVLGYARGASSWRESSRDAQQALERAQGMPWPEDVIADAYCAVGKAWEFQFKEQLDSYRGRPIDPDAFPTVIVLGMVLAFLHALRHNPTDPEARGVLMELVQVHTPLLAAKSLAPMVKQIQAGVFPPPASSLGFLEQPFREGHVEYPEA